MFSATLFHISISVVSCIGFVVSLYIFIKKRKNKKIVCPLRGSCDRVLASDFNTLFGIPLEVFGMGYFGLLAFYHVLFFFHPIFSQPVFVFIHAFLTIGGGLLSLYLILIQAFVLRSWCTWCIISAIVSFSITVLFFLGQSSMLPVVLAHFVKVNTVFHLFGMAVGVGAVTITDVFFFKFLKDYKITDEEESTLGVLSQVIWAALGLLFITGILLYIPKSEELLVSGKFLTKMIVLCVIAINGFVLSFILSPKLKTIDFGHRLLGDNLFLRKVSCALGAISISSWYFAFFLGSMRGWNISFLYIFVSYVCILSIAIIGSQIFEYRLRDTITDSHKI